MSIGRISHNDGADCLCGSGTAFGECCGRFLSGKSAPATALQLMRSRYTAYVLGAVDYILRTHHPDTIDMTDRESVSEWSHGSEWLGLEVIATERGEPSDDEGVVEFVARYQMDGKVRSHRERSRFRKLDGRWLYVDGEMVKSAPVVRGGPKIGRNDPCPCGSGKKYKKCCGR